MGEIEIPLADPLKEAGDAYVMGTKLLKAGQADEAILEFQKSVRLKPNVYESNFNLAAAFEMAGRIDDALEVMKSIVSIFPDTARGWHGMGTLFEFKGNAAVAAVCHSRASELEPRNPVYRWDRCQNFLKLGSFAAGWDGSESRMSSQENHDFMRQPPPPYFEGQDLSESTVLVWAEQGMGEQLMGAGLLEEFIPSCKKVIFEIDERLVNVMRRSFPSIEVYSAWDFTARKDAYARADYQVPGLTIARFTRLSFDDFPDRGLPYIRIDEKLSNEFRAKYEVMANGRPIVGIAWRSSMKGKSRDHKTVPLKDMEPIWSRNAFFVSLQYGEMPEAGDDADGGRIHRDPDIQHYGDFDPVLAQIAAMDAVVTISNTVLHAAGSISVPTMAIIPGGKFCHWYWFLRRTDCPWYPSVNLFRPEPETDGATWYATSVKRIAARIAEVIG